MQLTIFFLLQKFVSNLYKLFDSNALEIMIPLEFLQSSLFVGQVTPKYSIISLVNLFKNADMEHN